MARTGRSLLLAGTCGAGQRRRGLARPLDLVAGLEWKVPPARIGDAWPCTSHWRSAGAVGVEPAPATGIVVDRGVRHDPRVLAVELDQHPGSIGQWLLVRLAVLHQGHQTTVVHLQDILDAVAVLHLPLGHVADARADQAGDDRDEQTGRPGNCEAATHGAERGASAGADQAGLVRDVDDAR
jgi:hypothetical protein